MGDEMEGRRITVKDGELGSELRRISPAFGIVTPAVWLLLRALEMKPLEATQ
jgi:hypothetical protein